MAVEQAVQFLREQSGLKWDSSVVETFLRSVRETDWDDIDEEITERALARMARETRSEFERIRREPA